MAYTLPELFLLGTPPEGFIDTVTFNLTITQEDGRSAWGSGTMVIDGSSRQVQTAAEGMEVAFSDRDSFRGVRDRSFITLREYEEELVRFDVTSLTWGNQASFLCPLQDVSLGKVYYGWGDPIGHGAGSAIHLFSLFNHERKPA